MSLKTDDSKSKGMENEQRGLFTDFLGLKQLWPDLRTQKHLIIVAIVLIPVISLLEMSYPLILRHAIDNGIIAGNYEVLLAASAAYLAVVVTGYLARSGQAIAMAMAVHRMIRSLRMRLFHHVMNLRASFHDRSMSGALVTRATGDFDNLSESLNMGVLTSVVDIAVLIGVVFGMFALDWHLALMSVVLVPLMGWVVQQFSKGMKTAMLKARTKLSALNAFTQECLYGNQTVKLLTAEKAAQEQYDRLNVEFRDAQMGSVVLDAVMFSVLDGIASVTVGLVLWLVVDGAFGLAAVSAGVLVAFVQYVQQLFEPLKQLGNKIAMLQGAFTSIDRIFGVLRQDERIGGMQPAPKLCGDVRFEHVSFAYSAQSPVLKDVSFHLQAGHSLALVGATGSGKSTIIKLLSKLYDGYQGRILIDGADIAALEPSSLREQIAIVPQDIVLFDGSIAFNIGLARPEVGREAIIDAARQVGAHEFIKRLPNGYDSEIREQGSNLSHGQRQLIAFARALVRDPGLIILDEATSSVDPESEATVQAAIARILKGRSVVVIAHRLSTIRQCDQIVVLSQGEVTEAGRHEELLARKQAYYKMHYAFA